MIDLNPYIADPLFLGRAATGDTRNRRTILAFPLVIVVATLIFEMTSGRASLNISDVVKSACGEAFSLYSKAGLPSFCERGSFLAPTFPIQRDLFSVISMTILAGTAFTAAYQWGGYARLVGHMTSVGAIVFPDGSARLDFNTSMLRANEFLHKLRSWSYFVLLSSVAVMLSLAYAQWRWGVFGALAPGNTAHWTISAYRNWWANPANSSPGFIGYIIVGVISIYIITMQNIVGMRVLYAFWQCRERFSIGADYVNADGYYGWSPIRQILSPTYLQVAGHGYALALVGVTLPPGIWINLPYALLAAQWIITLPFYLLLPAWLTRKKVLDYKSEEVRQLSGEVNTLKVGKSRAEQLELEATFAERIEKVRSVPTLPFRRPRDSVVIAIGIVADTAAVISIAYVLAGG